MSVIELEQVSYRYGRNAVLRNVSLQVDEGSSFGLIGPNGSGKSTALRLVATLLRPTQGRVLVNGFDTRLDARNVRRRIGYVPDQLGVYPGLTVWQYLSFFARSAGVPSIERKTSIETLLRVVDLFDERQTEAERLSRGMRRRLALARALVHNPTVLILDDPLGGLDGRGRLELLEVLKELRGMGLTVLLSGHLLGDIVQLCSHVGVLRDGCLIRTVTVGSLLQEEPAGGKRVEIEVLLGEEIARAALAKLSDVRDVQTDGRTVSFAYHGDQAGLSTLLDRLVEDGVQITRFGPGPERFDELAAGLAETNGPTARVEMWSVLVGKEFVSRLQGKLAYVLLSLLVSLFTGLVLLAFWLVVVSVPTLIPVIGSSAGSGAGTTIQSLVASNRGAFLFYALAICILATVFSIAPAVASSALSSERENNTMDLLLISGLKASSVVTGKLLAAVLFVLLLVSTAIPGFAIAWMFGGVSIRDIVLVLAVVVATVLFISAVGLLFSAVARSSTMAALYTYSVVYLLALGSLMLYLIGAAAQNEAAARPFLALNPFIALLSVPETLSGSLQQTLPFQYRPALDLSSHDWLGLALRYPRWINTLVLYLLGTVVLALATGLAIDPCHRWKTRGERGRS